MRTLTASVITELQKNQVQPFLAFEATFRSGIVRCWTGYGDLNLGSMGAFPSVSFLVLSQPNLAAGDYYAKLVKMDAGGSPIAISDESSAITVVNYRQHYFNVTVGDYPHGLGIYIGTTSGAQDKYLYVSNADLTSSTGQVIIEQAGYVAGTVPIVGGTYKGIGTLGTVSAVSETTDVAAVGMQFTLSGIPSDLMAAALAECRTDYPVKLWIGFLTTTGTVIADPCLCFAGRMDAVSMSEGIDTATISISAENQLIDLQRPRLRRFTDDDQKRTYPTDDGFKFVPLVQEWNGAWGKLK